MPGVRRGLEPASAWVPGLSLVGWGAHWGATPLVQRAGAWVHGGHDAVCSRHRHWQNTPTGGTHPQQSVLSRTLAGGLEGTMPKRGRMFAGITRQVVISDETHQLLRAAAQREQKYIGELADEILRRVLTRPPRRPRGREPQE